MIEIILPAMGEGIIEAEITRWLISEGDPVETDQPLVEVATDKVDSEIPSPGAGTIHKIMLQEGDTAKVGQVMAVIAEKDEVLKPERDPETVAETPPEPASVPDQEAVSVPDPDHGPNSTPGNSRPQEQASAAPGAKKPKPEPLPLDRENNYMKSTFLSPVIRKLAMEHGLYPSEIQEINGSGLGGRITRSDVLAYLAAGKTGSRGRTGPVPGFPGRESGEKSKTLISREQVYGTGPSTIEEMDRMRRLIAEHMVYSKRVAPHVSSFVECDVTEMMLWRDRVKNDFQSRYGQKLTITTLILEACIQALKDYPGINVSVDEEKIIRKHQINLGMATALPDGNLIVPVIREADTLSLHGLAKRVNDLAERARRGELQPDEIKGGTFTVTNMGQFGNFAGTPIINQPQSAILAIGAIARKPAVVEIPEGESIGIRNILVLTLSYDHRVVDGALGGSYLRAVGDKLQEWDTERAV
jgi:2-oxoglutarate dehydrogenase E2 component (dihydrolipoamide succinyltransferase)